MLNGKKPHLGIHCRMHHHSNINYEHHCALLRGPAVDGGIVFIWENIFRRIFLGRIKPIEKGNGGQTGRLRQEQRKFNVRGASCRNREMRDLLLQYPHAPGEVLAGKISTTP